jgi:DNA transposition AAA+ family ATPase
MGKTSLREELQGLMDEKGTSLSAVSRSLGLSSTTLSQWMNNCYPGNIAGVEEAVKQFLELAKERSKSKGKGFVFVPTSVARKVFEIASLCHVEGEIGVVYGIAGLGKTEAVRQYARKYKDVILVEADLGYTAKVLFSELHKRVGLAGRGGDS